MTQKRLNPETGVLVLSLLAIFVVFLSFSGALDSITGQATSRPTNVSITVGNNAPQIISVSYIPAQQVTEAGVTYVTFYFSAYDQDGAVNLNGSSAAGYFQLTGEATRSNLSCVSVGSLDAFTTNYSCTVDVWYFDGAGSWTINATIYDINGAYAENSTTTFTLQETTAIVISPDALTWPTLSVSDTNRTSNNDPVVINNTANKDIDPNNVTVNAVSLQGQTVLSEYIYAENFTVDIDTGGSPPAECNGPYMINNTAVGIVGATVPAGNLSAGQGQEDLYFCLTELPSTISAQTYSTQNTGPWTVSVS